MRGVDDLHVSSHFGYRGRLDGSDQRLASSKDLPTPGDHLHRGDGVSLRFRRVTMKKPELVELECGHERLVFFPKSKIENLKSVCCSSCGHVDKVVVKLSQR